MKRLITSPSSYLVWAALVSVALYASYVNDPYVFAFTAIGLAWLTGAVGLTGLATCVLAKQVRARDRVIIVGAIAVAAAAIARAFAMLSTFRWA
jgi:Zn-dependent alcohol dehydrogenase